MQLRYKRAHPGHKTCEIDYRLTESEALKAENGFQPAPCGRQFAVGYFLLGMKSSPLEVRGILHRVKFENKGTVLQFEPEKILQYSHLSSLSRLPDKPENYTILEFRLAQINNQTKLSFTASNFPTETIHKHFAFYWNVTLEMLKRMIEKEG